MNRTVRRTTFGLAIAIGTLGIGGGAAGAADTGFTTSGAIPPPPPQDGKLVAPPPEKSATCEGNAQCGVLQAACELVGGTYNGWQSWKYRPRRVNGTVYHLGLPSDADSPLRQDSLLFEKLNPMPV